MVSGRKFGVKNTDTKRKKTFGVRSSINPQKVKIDGVTGKIESCPINCPGEFVNDVWIHSSFCKWSAVLWKFPNVKLENWKCPYECIPQEFSEGWTHDWRCPFWNKTGRTPFDHTPPVGVIRKKKK